MLTAGAASPTSTTRSSTPRRSRSPLGTSAPSASCCFDVDYTARQLLMDVAGDDAGRLLRGWPDLVAAAATLWSSLPGQGFGAGAHTRDEPITRLVSVADAIGRQPAQQQLATGEPARPAHDSDDQDPRSRRRPGAPLRRRHPGPSAPRATATSRQLAPGSCTPSTSPPTPSASPCTSTATAGTRPRSALTGPSSSTSVTPPTQYRRPPSGSAAWPSARRPRAGTSTDGSPRRSGGEASRPIEDDTRISRALAGWDIQAHRTLASDAWPTNMVLITRTQGLIAGAGMVLVDAAQLAGHLEPTDRLTPAIAEAGRAWSNLASRWGDLTAPDARLDPDLMRAAAEVRAAYRELTHDSTTMASLDVIATRPGLERGTRATLHALESGSELAYVVAEKADAPGLTGPARALSIRAHNDVEAGLAARRPKATSSGSPRRHPRPTNSPPTAARARVAAHGECNHCCRIVHRGSSGHSRAHELPGRDARDSANAPVERYDSRPSTHLVRAVARAVMRGV